ncbi:MAG: glucosyl-3-phosphoglycerate synthase [Actinomycetota bacterium]
MALNETPWTLVESDFDLQRVATLKGSETISVVVPARNESLTVGHVLDSVRSLTFEGKHFVDEIVVVNDHSSDDTATVAARHGARVVNLPGHQSGKGLAMAHGLATVSGSLVVFLDADVTNTAPDFVPRLVQPLLDNPAIKLVKAYYERPLLNMPTGGGRVTEIAARPILSLLFPGLGEIRQPLAGETAVRRGTLDQITFESGYGVEIALLIDVARTFGVQSIAQIDLGVRRHRNRPIEELRPMSVEVLRAALERHGVVLPEN